MPNETMTHDEFFKDTKGTREVVKKDPNDLIAQLRLKNLNYLKELGMVVGVWLAVVMIGLGGWKGNILLSGMIENNKIERTALKQINYIHDVIKYQIEEEEK